jgi:hypothetical protein
VKNKAIRTVSSLILGNVELTDAFFRIGGIPALTACLALEECERVRTKALFLVSCLIQQNSDHGKPPRNFFHERSCADRLLTPDVLASIITSVGHPSRSVWEQALRAVQFIPPGALSHERRETLRSHLSALKKTVQSDSSAEEEHTSISSLLEAL